MLSLGVLLNNGQNLWGVNMIIRASVVHVATALMGLGIVAATAYADEVPQIVVEATAPVQTQTTNEHPPGGVAPVGLLSVKYQVHVQDLDLTKHADVIKLEDQIKVAAKKGCADIQKEYPLHSMSDEQACVTDATKKAMVQAKDLIAAAEKNAKK
jgi:UrcA family protein